MLDVDRVFIYALPAFSFNNDSNKTRIQEELMIIGIGALLMFIGVVWMIVTAVQNESTTGSKAIWGILIFFTGPLASTIYFFMKKAGLVPLILMWIAVLFYGYGIFTSAGEIMRQLPN